MIKVAIFTIPPPGHANPMLAVASALAARNDVADVRSFGPPELAHCFSQTGAAHISIENDPDTEPMEMDIPANDLAYRSFILPLGSIRQTMRDTARFAPDVVLYDPFSVQGLVAARTLRVPSAMLITFPGYGSLGDDFVRRHTPVHQATRKANERYRKLVGLDILGDGFLPVFFPSGGLSIITTIEPLSRPINSQEHPLLHSLLARFVTTTAFVGPCIGKVRMTPTTPALEHTMAAANRRLQCTYDAEVPYEFLDIIKRRGKRVVLFSLGTVITDFRFDSPVGGASTGCAFLRTMIRHTIAALGNDPDLIVIAAIGHRFHRENDLRWPDNFIVRSVLPQTVILKKYADAFITHHGANSTLESILAGVPMVSLPGAGDQIPGASIAIGAGVAVAFWDLSDPYTTCTPELLGRAVRMALHNPGYAHRCHALRSSLLDAGGAAQAAQLVHALARRAHGRAPEYHRQNRIYHTQRSPAKEAPQ